MIDTLKLAKRLQQANLSAEQSEAIAEALAEAQANCVTILEAVCGIAHRISNGIGQTEK